MTGKDLGVRALLGLLRALSHLPLPLLAGLGWGVGRLLFRLARSRRRIALRNLQLCFPDMPEAERRAMAREHFGWLGRSLFERALLWYAPPERIRQLIQVEGDIGLAEREFQSTGRSTMWLCPHFVGLDVAGAAILLCQPRPGASIYQTQSNAVIDAAMKQGRLRLGDAEIFPRQDSIKPLLRAVRQGRGFFNLPDMDFGLQDAAFVPFFGIPAATLLAPSRLARMLNMVVQPVIAELLPGGRGYKVHFLPPLENFPTQDAEADTARMNRFIEDQIRLRLPQYLWVHKRFKTRPPGVPSVY
ncbi:MAG: lipid A biosynthesis acyltransferase [Rubrivivax sp.]|nr:MAG: lipid A biosynthesis acyltransferase [Rubrivivax sp.]